MPKTSHGTASPKMGIRNDRDGDMTHGNNLAEVVIRATVILAIPGRACW